MPTAISNLWTPQIWIDATREAQLSFPAFINSAAAQRSAMFDALASGGGTSANVPTWRDISGQADEIQVENTAPSTDNTITAGTQIAPILNRVTKNSVNALAAGVSGDDPVGEITAQLGARRALQRNKTAISLLRGAFGTGTGVALNAASELAACRLSVASETGASPTAEKVMSVSNFLAGKALLGELEAQLINGAIVMHSAVKATLEAADAVSFKDGLESGLPFRITTYRGIPVFVCDDLVRAGTTSGFVYETYLLAPGCLAYGEKPQAPDTGDTMDVATLQYDVQKGPNTAYIYDRTRFIMHLNGMKWAGSPAGQSATNAELAAFANWDLAVSNPKQVGAVLIVTNG